MDIEGVSEKSYGVAVALSATFGVLGIHHFYLGRIRHGLLDLTLTVGGIGLIVFSESNTSLVLLGVLMLVIDGVHTLVITILLLTGNYRDGRGMVVAYPGQRFPIKETL